VGRFLDGVVLLVWLFAVAGCSREAPRADSPPPRREAVKNVKHAENPKDSLRGAQRSEDVETYVKPFTLAEKEFQIELAQGVVMEFVGIPPGSFMMGNNLEGVRRHRETIAEPYYLGKYEVTQQQWQALMGNNPSLHKGPPTRPVERPNRIVARRRQLGLYLPPNTTIQENLHRPDSISRGSIRSCPTTRRA
jgi:formylglycine-generating enzyme required for sulfatase activity